MLNTYENECQFCSLSYTLPTHLSIVNSDHTPNHLRHDDHVTEMSLHDRRFLIRGSLLLGFAQFLDEAHGTTFQTALEATASTGMHKL